MTSGAADDMEWARFRQQYYGLLVALLAREPPGRILAELAQGGGRAEAAGALHPLLGEGWRRLDEALAGITEPAAAEEWVRLFAGPFQPEVVPYESWYLTGQLFQAPLVAVKGFLARIGLERRSEEYAEPEDALAFELEAMNWMITRELAAASADEARQWTERQEEFLRQHVLVWAPQCAADLGAAPGAHLYRGVAGLVQGLLALERQRLLAGGGGEIETLEQARRRYGSPRGYSGPVYDPSAPAGASGKPPAGESE